MYRRNFLKNSGLAIAGTGLSGLAMPTVFAQGPSDDEIKKQNKQMANGSLKEKLLLDTDIGSDINDYLCLVYLLCKKQCEILGITTLSGDSVNRTKLASALLKAAGSDGIPIYPGVEQPLLIPQKQPVAHQVRYLSKWPHETKFP
ncbi:MAG: twin-arginine translocation signal domain-containing protein, partial [Chloroflexi bacterium]